MTRRVAAVLTAIALVAQLGGCAPAMWTPPPVPPPQAEAIPLPPVSAVEVVWRPGHWNWDGNGFRWIPGEFQPRTSPNPMWRQGFWQQGQGGWTWVPPGWM